MLDLGMAPEPLGQSKCVITLLTHAQRQGLETPQRQPRFKGPDAAADQLVQEKVFSFRVAVVATIPAMTSP